MKIAVAGGTGTVGRRVVDEGRKSGHEMVVLSRAAGIDLEKEADRGALERALAGVETIVDAANPHTLSRTSATAFFEQVTRRLQEVGSAEGVRHLVTVSIVGVDRVPGYGYYEAKRRHEEAALRGPIPATVVRATQFHEFPGEIMRRTRVGPVALMASMRSQPVAARSVGEFLVEVASRPVELPSGRRLQIAGPREENLVDLARRFLGRRGLRTYVVPLPIPGPAGRALRAGGGLPTPDVPTVGPDFEEWLGSEDAADFEL